MRFKEFWKNLNSVEKSKTFSMIRQNDESGTSGTGKVLDGIIFPCGKIAICWDTKNNLDSKVSVNSVSVFDNWDAFYAVHIGQHPTNNTKFISKLFLLSPSIIIYPTIQ